MRSLISLVTLILALFAPAESSVISYNVHEKRAHLPYGWSLTRRHLPASTMPLRFALKQRNINSVEDCLYDVSHPKSPNYGKHWTAGDIVRMFAPSNQTIEMVRNWLIATGIDKERITLGRSRGWIQVNTTVEEAERLVHTEYNVYTHTSGKEHVACEVYHLPEHVQPYVDFVIPSVHFNAKPSHRSGDAVTFPVYDAAASITSLKTTGTIPGTVGQMEYCNEYITPNCLRALYNFFYQPVAINLNSYGIVEYAPQTFQQSDLQLFARNYSVDLIGKEPYIVSIDGGYMETVNHNFHYNGEADLDLQFGMSLVTGEQTVTLYQTGDGVESASFNNFIDAIDDSYCVFEGGDDRSEDAIFPDQSPGGYKGPEACGTVKPTYVISTSYTYNEAQLTPFYAERQCAEYAKLGLMGITVLYSSGDYGVAGYGNSCLTPDGGESPNGKIFSPSFPGTCPYITSVGATMMKPNASVSEPEMACMKVIYSGGGFSNYFAMPEYQKDAVDHYLTNHHPNYPANIWNSTGISRGFPDIAVNGANYVTAINGEFQLIYGTSCSSPALGALLTMINDARLANGKSTIGFINPVIYRPEFAQAFNDVTEGTNPGCGTPGYNTSTGWDPVTGLGTPDFRKLLELWLELP